jgi:GAF domain-containing protein
VNVKRIDSSGSSGSAPGPADALHDVSDAFCRATALSNADECPEIALRGIMEQLHRVVDYRWASVSVLEMLGWHVVASCAFPPTAYPGQPFADAWSRVDGGALDQVRAARQPLTTPPPSPTQGAGGEAPAGSWLGTPLLARDHVVGVLSLVREGPGGFSRQEVQLAMAFAGPAATALENARLVAADEESRHRLQSIQATATALSAEMNPDTLPDKIVAEAARAFQAEATSLMLWNEDESALVIKASHGLSPAFVRQQHIPREQAEASFARGGLVLPYVQDLTPPAGGRQPGVEELDTVLTVPLLRQDPPPAARGEVPSGPTALTARITGALSIYSKGHARDLGTAEIELAQAFASQAAIAIENALLYRQVSHHLEEVQILNQVAVAATSTLRFEEVIRRSIAALLGKRNFERVNILLLDEARQNLWLHPALAGGDAVRHKTPFRVPMGEGIIGWCARNNKPLRVGDIRQEPRYLPGYHDTLSEMCVPLRSGERVIGVLDVQSSRLQAFADSDERLLTTLAGQLSTIIENSRLFAEAQQRVRELTALTRVSQAINQAEGLERVMSIVLDQAFDLVGGQEGSIILIDPPGSNRLRIVAERGLGLELVEVFNNRPVYTHEGTYKHALRDGKVVEVADTAADPDFLTDVGSRARSLTNVPLLTERGAIGLIAMDRVPRDEAERRLLLSLAGMAAVAIDRERLHQETANRLSEVSTLFTLATQIAGSFSLSSLLETIVAVLRMTLDCRSCSIFLLDETSEYLQLEAGSGPSSTWKGIARMRVGEGASGRAIAQQRVIYIPDARLEADFVFFDPLIRSLLVVPLVVRGKPIGTLSIDDIQPDAFDEELRLLTIAATQAAVAIENVSLYESLQESYRDLERAYEELRQLDTMKSELIQNVSHELRTPLTFIKGYVELLQDGEMGDLEPGQQAALAIVATKAEGLSRLVDDIICAQQVGHEQMQLAPHSLAALGHLAMQAAEASAHEAGITLVSDIQEVPCVLGDGRRLGQVFDNLIQNAIKFSDPGRRVVVRVRPEDSPAGILVRVEVQDWGIGIADEQRERIWERFDQVDGTTTRRFGGTGLGLAIVKQIVEAHRGFVGVESKPRAGSLFYFAIPAMGPSREQGG